MMIMALPLNVATRHEIMIVQATVIVKGNDHQVMEMIIMAAGILPQSVVAVAVQEVVATPVVTEGMDHPWTDMEVQIATAVLIGDILVIEAMVTDMVEPREVHLMIVTPQIEVAMVVTARREVDMIQAAVVIAAVTGATGDQTVGMVHPLIGMALHRTVLGLQDMEPLLTGPIHLDLTQEAVTGDPTQKCSVLRQGLLQF
mmetsp:Transcript_33998/g.54505  ORF Transcript_33998/g.54505 Transcript_33998/m.54505 type:complete len:200 (+) Transcript_33998:177-776(+)